MMWNRIRHDPPQLFPSTRSSVAMEGLPFRRPRSFVLLAALLLLLSANLYAQANFVYTNNNNFFVSNTISAFSVDSNGVLTQIPGSPFLTGGTGNGANGFIASNRIAVCANFLYASNDFSGDVSGFSIDPTTGSLTPVPGSPFPAGGTTFFGISLATTPNCQFLIAGNGDATDIFVFSIAANGALTPVPGSPFPAISQPDGIKVSPNGQFLAVVLSIAGFGELAMYSVASTGALSPVPGSPFPLPSGVGAPTAVDINCSSNLLFVAEVSATVDVFSIGSDGIISRIPGSPFSSPPGFNILPVLTANGQYLFVSNFFGGVNAFGVASGGGLTTLAASPFSTGSGSSSGLAVNSAGTLLYVSDFFANLVSVLRVASDGTLTLAPGSPVSTGESGGLFSLAAFPPKTCALQVTIDIKPGSSPTTINPRSAGKIPVAILSSPSFDAVRRVNATSLTFGATGNESSLAFCDSNGEDVNGDGLLDLVCHFNTTQTGFAVGDTEGILKGKTLDGTPIVGTEPVNIVPQ